MSELTNNGASYSRSMTLVVCSVPLSCWYCSSSDSGISYCWCSKCPTELNPYDKYFKTQEINFIWYRQHSFEHTHTHTRGIYGFVGWFRARTTRSMMVITATRLLLLHLHLALMLQLQLCNQAASDCLEDTNARMRLWGGERESSSHKSLPIKCSFIFNQMFLW